MMRRTVPFAVLVLALALVVPAGAQVQAEPALVFEHDASREIRSGLYAGDDGDGDPLAGRFPGTYESFELEVPAGTRHASLAARIAWDDDRVNLDLTVYRVGPDGRVAGVAVARSATSGSASELATYAPPDGRPIEPGRYLVVIDNVCSRDADDDPRSPNPAKRADCGIGEELPDEDDFSGSVTLGNQYPAVTLTGPDAGEPQQALTFTALAEDRDGAIAGYWFDLDGNGTYEHDGHGSASAATSFDDLGSYTVGVQVLDDAGAVAYGARTVTIAEPPREAVPARSRPPLLSFRLNRRTFGGARNRRLIVSYRLRERARVNVVLRRGSRFVRRIGAGVRRARRTYRIALKPARLRRGVYTVSIAVAAASGRVQVARLSSRRR
jgi:hypothetical protein